MSRIFLVGYFVGKEDKMLFADLLADKDLYFLESSTHVRGGGNIIKVPQRLSGLDQELVPFNIFKKPKITAKMRKLYRRDLIAYFSGFVDNGKSITKERSGVRGPFIFILYCWALISRLFRIRRCKYGFVASLLLSQLDFIAKFSFRNAFNFGNGREIRSFLIKLGFVAGLNYYVKTVSRIGPKKGDMFLSWGSEYSGNILLDQLTDVPGVIKRTLEYGEVPGTISVNREGIFGDSDVAKDWQSFCALPFSDRERADAVRALKMIDYIDAGSRDENNGMYDLYKNMFSLNPERKKVVYVNGSELVASGHIYNRSLFRNGLLNPNACLLERACKAFPAENHIIMYKDHPMTMRQSESHMLTAKAFPGVVFANDLNMKTLLDMADLVLTFPSKVVMTSLMMKVKTVVIGQFTVPEEDVDMGYFIDPDLGRPELFDGEASGERYLELVTRLLKYKLIKYDRHIFSGLDPLVERSKLLALIY